MNCSALPRLFICEYSRSCDLMFAYRLHSRLDLKATKHDGDVAYRLAFKKKIASFIHSFIQKCFI